MWSMRVSVEYRDSRTNPWDKPVLKGVRSEKNVSKDTERSDQWDRKKSGEFGASDPSEKNWLWNQGVK